MGGADAVLALSRVGSLIFLRAMESKEIPLTPRVVEGAAAWILAAATVGIDRVLLGTGFSFSRDTLGELGNECGCPLN